MRSVSRIISLTSWLSCFFCEWRLLSVLALSFKALRLILIGVKYGLLNEINFSSSLYTLKA